MVSAASGTLLAGTDCCTLYRPSGSQSSLSETKHSKRLPLLSLLASTDRCHPLGCPPPAVSGLGGAVTLGWCLSGEAKYKIAALVLAPVTPEILAGNFSAGSSGIPLLATLPPMGPPASTLRPSAGIDRAISEAHKRVSPVLSSTHPSVNQGGGDKPKSSAHGARHPPLAFSGMPFARTSEEAPTDRNSARSCISVVLVLLLSTALNWCSLPVLLLSTAAALTR